MIFLFRVSVEERWEDSKADAGCGLFVSATITVRCDETNPLSSFESLTIGKRYKLSVRHAGGN